MQQLAYDDNWPELWKYTFIYDSLELWGSRKDLGYSYQYRNRHQWILNAVEELLPSGSEILDVAGASGNFTLPLAEKGYRLTWNDMRIDMAGLVQKNMNLARSTMCLGTSSNSPIPGLAASMEFSPRK